MYSILTGTLTCTLTPPPSKFICKCLTSSPAKCHAPFLQPSSHCDRLVLCTVGFPIVLAVTSRLFYKLNLMFPLEKKRKRRDTASNRVEGSGWYPILSSDLHMCAGMPVPDREWGQGEERQAEMWRDWGAEGRQGGTEERGKNSSLFRSYLSTRTNTH